MIAAKNALRRKKTHEHSLDQTLAQIGTLEQQINSIESANINRETLAAMEKAGQAMKHIHNGLTPEKVDETMYVDFDLHISAISVTIRSVPGMLTRMPGTNYEIRMRSAKRSSMLSQIIRLETPSTRRTWKLKWIDYSRSNWMSRLSRQAMCRLQMLSDGHQCHRWLIVSL